MPSIYWNELEIIECLEVAPEFNEREESYSYQVTQERATLCLTIPLYDDIVLISVLDTVSKLPIIEFTLFVQDGIYSKKYPKFTCLEIRDCLIGPVSFNDESFRILYDKKVWPAGISVEVSIKPQIHIGFEYREQ